MIKPCPCGKSTNIIVDGVGKPKWAYVSCDCDEWMLEFRNDYLEIGTPESMERAEQVWNAAPRMGENK
jgi:hypothetical protein